MASYSDEFTKVIPEGPNYEISNYGRVFNTRTGREMVLSPNQYGELTVGLVKDGHQCRYSVKCLVARAFVRGESEIFNSPILLDNDVTNLYFKNIVWRPRWFAWQYKHQFNNLQNWYFFGPIVDRDTLIEHRNYIDTAKAYGLLCSNIRESIYNDRLTFPTHQNFAYVN